MEHSREVGQDEGGPLNLSTRVGLRSGVGARDHKGRTIQTATHRDVPAHAFGRSVGMDETQQAHTPMTNF